ncbi:MAG: ester cyclase [Flavobacteriales bacterium]|nr:ester cyclase [Flavobacteriales bacterium]
MTSTGIQALRDILAMYRTSMPDVHQEWLHASTHGDRTYIHYRMTGTNTGAYGDMPPTGMAVDVMGVDILRFQDGKAAEHWGYMEDMKMMTQLGLMPPPDAEAKK